MNLGELFAVFSVKVDNSSVSSALGALDKIRQRMVALGTVRAFANLTRHVTDFASSVMDAAAKTNSYAQGLGLTVQNVQELDLIAQSSGSNMQQLSVGLGMYERQLRLLANHRLGKNATAAFAQMGIDSSAAAKAIRSPDGLMGSIMGVADQFHRMGDTANRGALAQQLFGARAGRSVLSDVSGGSARLNELIAKRKAMGELDQKDIDNLRDLRLSWKGIETQVTATLSKVLAAKAPAIIEDLKRLSDWIQTHQKEIGHAFEVVLDVLEAVGKAIAKIVTFVDEHPFLIKLAAGILVFGKLATLAASVVEPVLAIGSAVGDIIALVPALGGVGAALLAWLGPLALVMADVAIIMHDLSMIPDAINAARATGDRGFLDKGDTMSGHEFDRDELEAARLRGLRRQGISTDDAKSMIKSERAANPFSLFGLGGLADKLGGLDRNADVAVTGVAPDGTARVASGSGLTNMDALRAQYPGSGGFGAVNVAGATITINGVKGASEASSAIAEAQKVAARQAYANLVGGR